MFSRRATAGSKISAREKEIAGFVDASQMGNFNESRRAMEWGGGLETCACCLVVSVCITAKKGKRERSMSRDFILKGGSFVCFAEKIC